MEWPSLPGRRRVSAPRLPAQGRSADGVRARWARRHRRRGPVVELGQPQPDPLVRRPRRCDPTTFTPKRLATEVGVLDLEVPRDRNGTFEPQTVRKGQRRREGIDTLVIGLDGRGLTLSAIQGAAEGDLRPRRQPRAAEQNHPRCSRRSASGRLVRWRPSTPSSSWAR